MHKPAQTEEFMLKNKNGFTLMELMAVVLIMGILASIAIPSYKTSVAKTKIVTNMPLLRALQDDMINYYNLHGNLPTRLTQLSINKKEFKNLSDTAGTHVPTNCTFTIGTTQKIGISMDCGNGWVIFYQIKNEGLGYATGERTIQLANDGNANSLSKIARGFGWPQKSGTTDTYVIK